MTRTGTFADYDETTAILAASMSPRLWMPGMCPRTPTALVQWIASRKGLPVLDENYRFDRETREFLRP